MHVAGKGERRLWSNLTKGFFSEINFENGAFPRFIVTFSVEPFLSIFFKGRGKSRPPMHALEQSNQELKPPAS